MSEEDYQRGLRGGEARVSSYSDWERWKDWKAGNDEYERRMEEEDEARLAALSTPAENLARINARILASEVRDAVAARSAPGQRAVARQRAQSEAASSMKLGIFLIAAICLIGGVIVGFILKWALGLPVIVTVMAAGALAWWRISVEVMTEFRAGEEKRRKEASEDTALQARYHPYPAGKSGEWIFCSVASCWCSHPKKCDRRECDCKLPRVCPSQSCDCGRPKVCPDPACNCGHPKIATDKHCNAIAKRS